MTVLCSRSTQPTSTTSKVEWEHASESIRIEVDAVCGHYDLNEPHRTMVSLIAATGLRVGELLGLRWGALNLEVLQISPGSLS